MISIGLNGYSTSPTTPSNFSAKKAACSSLYLPGIEWLFCYRKNYWFQPVDEHDSERNPQRNHHIHVVVA